MTRNRWRENLIGILLLVVGITYLAVQALSIIRGDHSSVQSDSKSIHINRYAFLNEVRTYITIISCIAGGWLLLRQRRAGWIISMPMILLFTTIVLSGVMSFLHMKIYDFTFYVGIFAAAFMLFILGLHLSLRNKYIVKKDDWIKVILLCLALALFYFVLQ